MKPVPPITKKFVKQALRHAKSDLPPQPPPCSQLETEPQVIAKLKAEIKSGSLTEVAARYDIKPSQLSDITYGRANLSKKVLAKIRLRMHRFYERLT